MPPTHPVRYQAHNGDSTLGSDCEGSSARGSTSPESTCIPPSWPAEPDFGGEIPGNTDAPYLTDPSPQFEFQTGCSFDLCTGPHPLPGCPPRPVGWPRSQSGTPLPPLSLDAHRHPEPGHGPKVPSAQGFIPHLGLGMLASSLYERRAEPDSPCRSPLSQGPRKGRLLTGRLACA